MTRCHDSFWAMFFRPFSSTPSSCHVWLGTVPCSTKGGLQVCPCPAGGGWLGVATPGPHVGRMPDSWHIFDCPPPGPGSETQTQKCVENQCGPAKGPCNVPACTMSHPCHPVTLSQGLQIRWIPICLGILRTQADLSGASHYAPQGGVGDFSCRRKIAQMIAWSRSCRCSGAHPVMPSDLTSAFNSSE